MIIFLIGRIKKIKSLKTFVQVLVSAQWNIVSFILAPWFAKCGGSTEKEADVLGGV